MAIGLPVYNGERFLAQSIESLLGQTFTDFAIYINDNASTDRTGEICLRYAEQDARIHYQRVERNIGMPGNFNRTFAMARSKYFRWQTADDYCDEHLLEDAVQVLEGDPSLALCYPRAIFVDAESNELYRWQDALHLLDDDPARRFRAVVGGIVRVHHHLGLMRADCLRRTGLWAGHVSADIGLVAELSLYGKFFQIEKYQFFRRVHEDSSSWATDDEEHQARTYHAPGVRRIPFSRARFHWRYAQAVARSPLPPADRLGLAWFLFKKVGYDSPVIAREALTEVRARLPMGG